MHEVSIAMSLLEIACERCKKAGSKRIESISLRLGRASGIQPDALSFAFDAVKTGTIASGASLLIDTVPISGTCNDCKGSFRSEDNYVLNCPKCGSGSLRVEHGYEMEIVEMEVEERTGH